MGVLSDARAISKPGERGVANELIKVLGDARDNVDAQMFLTGLAASNQPTGILSIGQTNAFHSNSARSSSSANP